MKVIREGHRYLLEPFENNGIAADDQVIQFIEKVPIEEGSTELKTLFNGTTNEELLVVLIDRLNFLNRKFPCIENVEAIRALDEALGHLQSRTKNRIERGVEGKQIK